MTKKTIKIEKHCGADRVSRDDGKALREWIENQWKKNDRLVFDFENVLIASVSFLDEAFAKLAVTHNQKELVNKLAFENLTRFDRALLNDLVMARIKENKIKGTATKSTNSRRHASKR